MSDVPKTKFAQFWMRVGLVFKNIGEWFKGLVKYWDDVLRVAFKIFLVVIGVLVMIEILIPDFVFKVTEENPEPVSLLNRVVDASLQLITIVERVVLIVQNFVVSIISSLGGALSLPLWIPLVIISVLVAIGIIKLKK